MHTTPTAFYHKAFFCKPLCAALVVVLFLLPLELTAEPVLIFHTSLKDEDLTARNLARVYSMQKRIWSNGLEVKVYMLPKNSKTHKDFVINFLRMQPHQLDRLWHRLLFSGTGSIPQTIETTQQMLNIVYSTPGAVGYVEGDSLKKIMAQESAKDE